MHRSIATRCALSPFIKCLALLIACASPAAGDAADVFSRLRSAVAKAERGDCRGSLKLIIAATAEAEFATVNAAGRDAIHGIGALCALQLGDNDTAYRFAFEATQSNRSTAQLWRIRFSHQLRLKAYSDAVASVEAMGSRHVEALDSVPIRWLYLLNDDLGKLPDKALQRRLLDVLAGSAYRPDEVMATNDGFKLKLAPLLLDEGKQSSAAALVSSMVEPDALVAVSLDLRLRTLLPADFSVRMAMERRLEQARSSVATHADSMSAVLDMADLLRRLGRVEESLAVLEAAGPVGPRTAIFSDLDKQRNWWWDAVARAQERLGHYEKAVAAYREGIAAKEGGTPNVSQTINLGHAHLRFGYPERAIAAVAVFEKGKYEASPYGLMEMRLVRGCAHAALGNGAAVKAEIAYVTEHERDHPEALTDLLLCTGDMEGAAAAMIRRLDDPERRLGALLQLSDYDPPVATFPLVPFESKFAELAVRADVMMAIKRAGGTRRFHLQAAEL